MTKRARRNFITVGTGMFLLAMAAFWAGFSERQSAAAPIAASLLSPNATNARVVFQKGANATSEIYTVLPGSGVSTGLRRGFHPAYSPDGTKIVFTDNTAGPTQGKLMLMNANGTNVRALPHSREGFSAAWSPDGSRLAFVRGNFVSTGDTGRGQLFVVDMTAGNEGANETAVPGMSDVSKPSWSSTNRLTFQCRETDGIPTGICVTSPIPSTALIAANPPTITDLSTPPNWNDRDPVWSWDGVSIAFMSTRDYPMFNASEIYVMDATGGNVRRVTTSSSFKTSPSWAPDGTKIVFSQNGSQDAANANLRIVNADGTGPVALTVFNGGDVFPNWGAAVTVVAPPSVLVTGAGSNSNVKVFGGTAGAESLSFLAYPTADTSGVRVASGDIDGDGTADLITANGPGSPGRVKVFSGADNSEIRNILPYDAAFTGGVSVASGDINGDGRDDIITGVGSAAPSHVKVFNGLNNAEIYSFIAFDIAFFGGVNVGAGDINGDGRTDMIVGNGNGAGAVKVFSGTNGAEIRNFFPFGAGMTGGVSVAGGDVNGDGRDDIIAGAGPQFSPNVKAFSGTDNAVFRDFYAYDQAFRGGVRVAAGDIDRDGRVDIITGPGAGTPPQVKVYSGQNESVIRNFLAYGESMTGGVFVAAAKTAAVVTQNVDLEMESMNSPLVVAQGSNFTFDFVIKNLSTSPATGVKIVFDPIPPSIRPHPIQTNCTMVPTTRVVTCTYPDLAGGATMNPSTIFVAEVAATVEVRATVSSAETDPNTTNNSKNALTLIEVPADVAILDPVSPASVVVNNSFTQHFRISNYGPAAASGIRLRAKFSPQLQPLSANYPCQINGDTMTCLIGGINGTCPSPLNGCPPGSYRDISIAARPLTPAAGTSQATTELTLTTDSVDNQLFNNERIIHTTIVPGPEAQVIGIEVTQAIQNLKNETPLVAGRPAFVRAHLKKLSPGTIPLTATLTVRDPATGATLGTLNNLNKGGTVQVSDRPKRGSLDDSFYFEVPNGAYRADQDWTAQGPREFILNVGGAAVTCAEPDAAPDCKVQVEFKKRRPFSLRLISTSGKKPDGTILYPTISDEFQTLVEIASHYPFSGYGEGGVELARETWTVDQEYCTDPGLDALLAKLKFKRAVNCAFGGSCEDFFIALTPESVVSGICGVNLFSSGVADINFGIPGTAAYPLSPPIGIKTDNSGNTNVSVAQLFNTRAHELGHNFGFPHGNSRISIKTEDFDPDTYFGFDIYREKIAGVLGPEMCTPPAQPGCDKGFLGKDRVYAPTSPEMMSYGVAAWITADQYKRVYDSLVPTAPRQETPARITAERVFQIAGRVSTNGTGSIDAVYAADLNGTLPAPPPAGSWAVSIRNASNSEIARYGITPSSGSEPGAEAHFVLIAPWNAGARSVVLERDGVAVATRQASANAPTITLNSPNGGETLNGPTQVTWTAADANSDPLKFNVEFSSDGGTTWNMIAVDVTGTSYTADLTRQRATSQGKIRVTASDGFHSASDESNAVFTIPPHAPVSAITGPDAGAVYVGEQLVSLRGMAMDVEDGVLTGTSMAWSSDRNGPLGTGESLNVLASTLAEGQHVITLTATDAGGQTAAATRTIQVFRERPNFPMAIAASPGQVAFTADTGTSLTDLQTVAIRNGGDGSLNWSASASAPWIRLSGTSGQAPADLEVRADATGMQPGTYTGSISLTANGAANSPQSITVTLTVLPLSLITGRVLTPSGLGVRNAAVILTDGSGAQRTALTSSFGVYSFAGVGNSQDYTLTVRSRRYRFTPRTISVNGNLTVPDLIGLE